jgi:hypothetical protein
VNDIEFSDIPNRYKIQVADSFKDRHLPLQLNGCSGNNKYHKQSSPKGSFKTEIVRSQSGLSDPSGGLISNNNIV